MPGHAGFNFSQFFGLVLQNPVAILFQKKSAVTQFALEQHIVVPLAIVLHKFKGLRLHQCAANNRSNQEKV